MNEAILAELQRENWMIEPRHLEALMKRLVAVESAPLGISAAGAKKSPSPVLAWREGEWGVVPVSGVLMKEVPWYFEYLGMAATAYCDIISQVRNFAEDDNVKGVILKIASPGGQVAGAQEAADTIFTTRGKKPVHAYCEDMTASGAYLLASQANTITGNINSIIGSIGVYCVYTDYSQKAEQMGVKVHIVLSGEHKGLGVPGVKITDAQLSAEQENIDQMAKNFKRSVMRGRGMKQENVDGLASGRTWLADQAKILGLIDEVGTFESVLSCSSQGANSTNQTYSEEYLVDLIHQKMTKKSISWTEAMSEIKRESPETFYKCIGDNGMNRTQSYGRTNGESNVNHTNALEDMEQDRFMKLVDARMKEKNIGFTEAAKEIHRENPDLNC